jgi:CubicO group peptidase (beta-lactamase class C family)
VNRGGRPVTVTGSEIEPGSPSFAQVDRAITGLIRKEATDEGAFAGAVLLVIHGGSVVKLTAYGYAELFDDDGARLASPRPMETETVFDLASITKAVATANLIARLFEEGRLRLTDPISSFLPAFERPDKNEISVADLLTHASGLANWLPFYLFVESGDEALELIADLPVRYPRGRRREYSDVNFVVLGKLIEAVAGKPLDRLMEEWIAAPLGLERTRYRPPAEWRDQIAATSLGNRMEERMCGEREFPRAPNRKPDEIPGWRRHVLVGEVNDANCHLVFGGVAGHAGLFSTAGELGRLSTALLEALGGGPEQLLRSDTLNYFTTPKVTPGQGLGWWTNRIGAFPRAFGHRGFTGTQLVIDPENELITVLLTNRVHGLLPYAEPASFTDPVVGSVYRALGLAAEVTVDPWLA